MNNAKKEWIDLFSLDFQKKKNQVKKHHNIDWCVIHCTASSFSSTNTTANWYVDSHWTATGENGAENSCTEHGIDLANFKSGLYCANLPSGNATTICFPLGLQHAQLYNEKYSKFYYKNPDKNSSACKTTLEKLKREKKNILLPCIFSSIQRVKFKTVRFNSICSQCTIVKTNRHCVRNYWIP